MKDSKLPANKHNKFLYCSTPSHQDCELNTLCMCPTCPDQGLICYLCSFVKPHSEHSKKDIIPIGLITRAHTNTSLPHNFTTELEQELKVRHEAHLGDIQRIRQEVSDILDLYEEKVNNEFFVLQEKLSQEPDDLFEKFTQGTFKDQRDLHKSVQQFIKRLAKKKVGQGNSKWVFNDDSESYLQLVESLKDSIAELKSNFSTMKKTLSNIVSGSLSFSALDMNIDEFIENITHKKMNVAARESSLSTCRTSEGSIAMSNHSPEKTEIQPEIKRTRTRPFTFGPKNDEEKENFNVGNILEESARKENQSKHNPDKNTNSVWTEDTVHRKRGKTEKSKGMKHETASSPKKYSADFIDDIGDYTIIKDNILEYRTLIESDMRLIAGKSETQRLIRKPEEKFDAVTFYSKVSRTTLEGFGFYCPIPLEGTRVDLEYRVYEGTQKGGKEVMRDFVSFDCDVAAVKEKAVIERILLRVPVKLEKKKWYTIVLCYLNEVKIGYEEMKWRDVGQFMFMGIEKRQVKEWLGMKTTETEKMFSLQFPYLIYSD